MMATVAGMCMHVHGVSHAMWGLHGACHSNMEGLQALHVLSQRVLHFNEWCSAHLQIQIPHIRPWLMDVHGYRRTEE